jgi:hypothetical protein
MGPLTGMCVRVCVLHGGGRTARYGGRAAAQVPKRTS